MQCGDPNPNIKVYIIAFNEVTLKQANLAFRSPWYHKIMIETTRYLESIMYYKTLQECEDEWKDVDYVGTMSYKAPRKMRVPNLTAIWPDNPDVVVFWSSGKSTLLITQALQHHPKFDIIWTKLIAAMGYDIKDITDPSILVYFGNYWMAKPEWMRRYMDFLVRARDIMERDAELIELLNENSTYKGGISKEKCVEVFGQPHYTHHPFVCERLSCFFFWKHGAKILDITVAPPSRISNKKKHI
jgi:hypothetical protein